MTEINFQEFREGTDLYPEVKTWLESQGFKEVWSCLIGDNWQGNILFAR